MRKSEFQPHPHQLLKNLDAERREKLGPLYGKFYVAPGVRFPSEFTEDGVWDPLPPKKPPASVGLAREEGWLKQANGPELEFRAVSSSVTGPSLMAATASAYRNSGESPSAKNRDFLSRQDISEAIEAADFSRDVETVKGCRNYRRRHLIAALRGIWRAASNPYGTGEILCFASVEGYAIEAGVSERALRYNLRELERIGVIQLVYAANTIRRPATYRLNLFALRRRRTYDELKKSRPPRRALHSVRHSSPPPVQAAAAPSPAAIAAPVPVAQPSKTPQLGSRQFDRTRKLRAEFKAKIAEIMEGCHGSISGPRGESLWVDEDSPLYRPPTSPEKAFIRACGILQLSDREGRELLKFDESKESS